MKQASFWPVRVTCSDHVAAGTMVWRRAGKLWLTVFAKATFSFEDGERLVPVDPQPIARQDVHAGGDRGRSLITPSDVVPFRNAADVVFVGCAHAKGNRPVRHARVGLAVERDGRRLIDKRLHIVGDRRVAPGGTPPAPEPFLFMPIVYERAFGGPTSHDNPVGVGVQPAGDGLLTMPNVVYPSPERREQAAGLGPLPSSWPLRAARLGAFAAELDQAVVTLPEAFDETFFQCAPPDQQLGIVDTEDVIFLDGVHKHHRHMQLPLPAFEVHLEAHLGRDELALGPRIDLIHIDGEARQCTLSWRGLSQLAEERDMHEVQVIAALRPREAERALPKVAADTLTGQFQFLRVGPGSRPKVARAPDGKGAAPPPPRHKRPAAATAAAARAKASGPPPAPRHKKVDISDRVTIPRLLAPEAAVSIQGLDGLGAPEASARASGAPDAAQAAEQARARAALAQVLSGAAGTMRVVPIDDLPPDAAAPREALVQVHVQVLEAGVGTLRVAPAEPAEGRPATAAVATPTDAGGTVKMERSASLHRAFLESMGLDAVDSVAEPEPEPEPEPESAAAAAAAVEPVVGDESSDEPPRTIVVTPEQAEALAEAEGAGGPAASRADDGAPS